ncbi:hypothetical protein DFH27DRAFT_236826 [Peziza echinospora]|nr:hypothetical protein DFH27DRAFT_236826 [Peziza echinospora]
MISRYVREHSPCSRAVCTTLNSTQPMHVTRSTSYFFNKEFSLQDITSIQPGRSSPHIMHACGKKHGTFGPRPSVLLFKAPSISMTLTLRKTAGLCRLAKSYFTVLLRRRVSLNMKQCSILKCSEKFQFRSIYLGGWESRVHSTRLSTLPPPLRSLYSNRTSAMEVRSGRAHKMHSKKRIRAVENGEKSEKRKNFTIFDNICTYA